MQNIKTPLTCLLIGDKSTNGKIKDHLLPPAFALQTVNTSGGAPSIRDGFKTMACVIISMLEASFDNRKSFIESFKRKFSLTPVIGIVDSIDIELIRLCGKIGIDKVIEISKLNSLGSVIPQLVSENETKVSLIRDLHISVEQSSQTIVDTLAHVEQNYLTIMSMGEILTHSSVSELKLLKEFNRSSLTTPKRILMCCKVIHAIKLMKNHELGLKEIAYGSGFSNEKRFIECFHRIFACTPGNTDET